MSALVCTCEHVNVCVRLSMFALLLCIESTYVTIQLCRPVHIYVYIAPFPAFILPLVLHTKVKKNE